MSDLFAALIGSVVGGLLTAYVLRQLLYESVEISRRERAQEQWQQSIAVIEAVRSELLLNIVILDQVNVRSLASLSHNALESSKQNLHVLSADTRQLVFTAETHVYQYNSLAQLLRNSEAIGRAVDALRETLNSLADITRESHERASQALLTALAGMEKTYVGPDSKRTGST